MALKGKWTDKVDGVDDALAEHINEIAHSVIELEESSYTASQKINELDEESKKIPEWAKQPNKPKYTSDEVYAVSYNAQNLTDTKKSQARSNISAAGEIVCSAKGENITIADASDQALHGLKIFGKSTQNGTPSPDAPVPIESVGDSGSVSLKIMGEGKPEQTLTISTPNGLGGIPFEHSSANHKDSNGNRWRCDIVDAEKGVLYSEQMVIVFKGTEDFYSYGSSGIAYTSTLGTTLYNGLCTHYVPCKGGSEIGKVNNTVYLSGSANAIFTDDRFVNNIPGFKAWLAEQYASGTPVTVFGMSETTREIPLSDEELSAFRAMHTNKTNTVIYNDGGAEMAVDYTADTKLYIDKKFAELSAAILNNA